MELSNKHVSTENSQKIRQKAEKRIENNKNSQLNISSKLPFLKNNAIKLRPIGYKIANHSNAIRREYKDIIFIRV